MVMIVYMMMIVYMVMTVCSWIRNLWLDIAVARKVTQALRALYMVMTVYMVMTGYLKMLKCRFRAQKWLKINEWAFSGFLKFTIHFNFSLVS